MPTDKDPQTRLDRVARDLSRTLLHGARPSDVATNIRPATVLTGQQMRIDLPPTDLNFRFDLDGSSSPLVVDHAQAAETDQFMNDAVGKDSATYLSLTVDLDIPTWVFQQRQLSLPNPSAKADTVPAGALNIVKLPSSVLREVEGFSDQSFVSLWSIDPRALIPVSNWQPAIFLRFQLRKITKPTGIPDPTQVYELIGTPEGDRWFLDQLGLLPGPVVPSPPQIDSIVLTLEKKDNQGNVLRSPALSEWSLSRANLTQESRPSELRAFAMGAPGPPSLPYIVLSGDKGQDQDALRLLQMASITNSGGYYIAATTDWADAESLILGVVLHPKSDPDPLNKESAWLPPAANALALNATTKPDTVRFNGLEHIEVSPYSPPGTVSFGWTRVVPQEPTTPEDKFGYGTLSIVDYSATDATGQPVPMPDAAPIISPMKDLPGQHYKQLGSTVVRGGGDDFSAATNVAPLVSSAMRLRATHHVEAVSAVRSDSTETHYYRGTLVCYDKASESPWQRLKDPSRRQIVIKPGFRDVFGNRFDASAAPLFKRKLFYTDAIISPTDWPGLHFGVYPEVQSGEPSLSVELLYDYDKNGFDATRAQRLREIRDQLRGVANDVTVSLLADPILSGPKILDIQKLILHLDSWANGDSQAVLPLGTFAIDGAVTHLTQCQPRVRIERKPDYLPSDADLPADQVLATLIKNQLISATVEIPLQTDAAPTLPPKPGDPERRDEFRLVAQKLQEVIATPCRTQVGFLRDHLNVHEIWLIPNSLFPSVPQTDASAAWSFATPCPLRNVLGNESFKTPDFTKNTSTDPVWKKYGVPLNDQAVVDQDFDELGRIAFRMLESETADLTSLIPRANAVTLRSLLRTREAIANQLATFNGTGQGPGFTVPLLDKMGDLDPAAISRVAKDAFLGDLSSFYTVSTILQLPLSNPGDSNIQTFQGKVATNVSLAQSPDPNQPTFSDILLSGGDSKVTLLYDLPPKATSSSDVPPFQSLTVNIFHVQLPLPGALPGASPFNEGPWIELALPFALTWKGLSESIPVAARTFPSKPIIRSTETTMPALNPKKVTDSDAALLSQWGWRFSFSLINGIKDVDIVHITVRYPQYQPAPLRLNALALAADWSPISLLNALVSIKLLGVNWDSATVASTRLQILDDLSQSLLNYVGHGPGSGATSVASALVGKDSLDVFSVNFEEPTIGDDAREVMKGLIKITWTPPSKDLTRVDTASLEAVAGANGNDAFLTGVSPVRGYKVSLTLKRNEKFLGQPANKLLIYQCAPVDSPLDSRPLNTWPALVFDMSGQSLTSALQAFFGGIFHGADLSQLSMEAGISLVWNKGSMDAVTPFSILPADMKPGAGSVQDVVNFVSDKCKELVGAALVKPPETDSASIRLRVKITASETASGTRTLINVPAIDFALPSTNIENLARRSEISQMSEQIKGHNGLRGVEGEFASALLQIVQKVLSNKPDPVGPVLFPHGVGTLEMTASVEPQKINFSVKITDALAKPATGVSPRVALEFAPSAIGDDILNYCVSLDTADDPVMKDCNAFVKKVGLHFGVTIPDLDADGIVDSFPSAPFSKTTMDPATAMAWAQEGLVVAGMKKSELDPTYGSHDHGHVAIVHATEDPAHPGYPMASWGSLGGRGKSDTSIRQSFPAAACNDHAVHFAFAVTS